MSTPSLNLPGKVAIVTGASSGIGLSTVVALLALGAKVLGVDISPAPTITENASSFVFHQTNITTADAPAAIVAAAQEAFGGRIDVLINAAGVLDLNSGVDSLRDEDWDRVIAINLTAPVKLMREVLKVMLSQKQGNIVNVSSKAGTSGAVAGAAYTASKHGLIGVTKNTAWLLKDDGIRCNAVAPGAIATNISKSVDFSKWNMKSTATIKPVMDTHCNIRTGEGVTTPDVVADAIVFLVSDLSRKTNGAVIPVDNAWSVI